MARRKSFLPAFGIDLPAAAAAPVRYDDYSDVEILDAPGVKIADVGKFKTPEHEREVDTRVDRNASWFSRVVFGSTPPAMGPPTVPITETKSIHPDGSQNRRDKRRRSNSEEKEKETYIELLKKGEEGMTDMEKIAFKALHEKYRI